MARRVFSIDEDLVLKILEIAGRGGADFVRFRTLSRWFAKFVEKRFRFMIANACAEATFLVPLRDSRLSAEWKIFTFVGFSCAVLHDGAFTTRLTNRSSGIQCHFSGRASERKRTISDTMWRVEPLSKDSQEFVGDYWDNGSGYVVRLASRFDTERWLPHDALDLIAVALSKTVPLGSLSVESVECVRPLYDWRLYDKSNPLWKESCVDLRSFWKNEEVPFQVRLVLKGRCPYVKIHLSGKVVSNMKSLLHDFYLRDPQFVGKFKSDIAACVWKSASVVVR